MSQRLVTNQGQTRRLTELDDSWMVDAACRGKDTNDFYEFDSAHPTRQQDITTFCKLACPVKDRCLIWALYVPETHGVWGGTTEDERRELRKRREVRELLLDTAV